MTDEKISAIAATLDNAAATATLVPMVTIEESVLSVEQAYEIQEVSIAQRLKRGERMVGMKMGLTSRAKMEQVGVNEPIFGMLTSSMIVNDGARVSRAEFCHPRIEPEIAFILKRDLSGPVTPAQAMLAVGGVCAALELIDSRYKDFKFTLPDVIADNTSASRFVLGSDVHSPENMELGNLGIVMELNGEIVEMGSSAAVLDHPSRSLAELANMLARQGKGLHTGDIVLTGGATAAVALKPGDHVRATVEDLGSVELRMAE